MEDPDTKKMIREQQRVMLDQPYDPLIKKMDLTPAEAAQLRMGMSMARKFIAPEKTEGEAPTPNP